MRHLYFILFFFTCCFSLASFGQNEPGNKGASIFKKYDDSFITPHLKRKHSVSLGPIASVYGPSVVDIEPNAGLHLGYNYLVMNRRKLKLSKKGKYRNEIKFGIGLHAHILTQQEFMLMGTFFRPLSRTKGRLFSWYFLSEYGIGMHRTYNLINDPRPTKFNLSLEIFRLQFGKLPAFLHFTFNYDVGNDFLDKERLNIGFLGGFRYYIFKPTP